MTTRVCSRCAFKSPADYNFCGRCGANFNTHTAVKNDTTTASPSPVAERRQLTVVFCDLVGSTELSQAYDPEDLRRIIRQYQSACEPVIKHYGGFVSRFLGDGILAIYGYPHADEDDAVNAVRAGLGMVEAVQALDWVASTGLSVQPTIRVGIATGLVVSGDLIGKDAAEEEAVVGETPNLAARVQSLASPNTVLIGARTRRLLGQRFALSSLGSQVLKGFRAPEELWRVESSIEASSRFEAMRAATMTTLVNRTQEMRILSNQWERCLNHSSKLILISGEAGIGKSRITEALRQRIGDHPHYYLRFQCSPYHINTALHPIAAHFESAAGIERTDSSFERLEKLRSVLRLAVTEGARILTVLSTLLSIDEAPDAEFEQLSAEGKRLATYDALIKHCIALSKSRPVLAVIEDIHWSDPTTLEYLEYFTRTIHDERILVLMTCRSGSAVSSERFAKATHITLGRLKISDSTDLVRHLSINSSLPEQIREQIVSKADGIPLFLEELTNTLLIPHSSAVVSDAIHTESEPSIPETLHDSLMARLDHAGAGKRIAQIASTIGRIFSFDLLVSIAQLNHDRVREGLDRLIESGLVFTEGRTPGSIYTFKHALLRDTAYSSLLRAERRTFHKRIAENLETALTQPAPELLAWHYTEAGLPVEAIAYWLQAGQAASQRSAHKEAVGQLHSGLLLLRKQPDSDQRNRRLLQYLVNLGPNLIATKGSGSAETEAVYREAVALSASLPESEDHFTAYWGWWRISTDFQSYADRAARLQRLAERLDDDALKLQAHHCQWATRFHLGDHEGCQQHIRAGIELYADRDYRSHAARYGGHDPRVCALGETAQSLWLTGYPDQAQIEMRRARRWAEELNQSGSLVHIMDMNLLLLRYRRDPLEAVQQADELIAFARENHFPEYSAKAEVYKGWALAKRGGLAQGIGIEMMHEGINSHVLIGTNEDPPVWLEMLADGYLDSGDYQRGLHTIEEAFRHTERTGLQFWQAELHRCRGELLQRMGDEALSQARYDFEQAIRISGAQGARSLWLRAATSLVRNADLLGDATDSRQRLLSILDQFDEGFETSDYRDARALCAAHTAS